MRTRSRKDKTEPQDPAQVIDLWLERDLTAAARAGELTPAFEVDDLLQQAQDVLDSGRWPVLSGDSGTGKTAVAVELVRRSASGEGPAAFEGKRVLQLSLAQRAASVEKLEQLRPAMQRLVAALLATPDVVPFFKDLHLAFQLGVAAQLQSLGIRLRGGLLAEGDSRKLAAMFEEYPELSERFVLVPVLEPSIERTERILAGWAHQKAAEGRARVTPDALHEAIYLSHRFLSRTRLPRKALDLLNQVASLSPTAEVDARGVIGRFCRTHAVPAVLVDPDIPLDPREVERHFGERVLGQSEAVAAVVRMISLIKSGLADVRRPFGVFLFVGPTGVGKTHLAQLLAEYLFGRRDRMVRFNMADYQQEQDVGVLFGNPEAWPEAQKRGTLTLRLAGHPFTVLLLDELEKAHPRIHDRFLQLVDEGAFINGIGELVSCRSSIIIATSNAGAELYRGKSLGFLSPADLEALDREVDRQLQRTFRFEFLNRFDQTVHFRPLTREDIRTIAARELAGLAQRAGFQRRGIHLSIDESVHDWLAVNGYDPFYGARVLRRTIERHVSVALAEALMTPVTGERHLELSVRGKRIVVLAAPAAPTRRPTVGEADRAPRAPKDLRAQAERLLASFATRSAALAAQREERSHILARLNESKDWQKPGPADALDRYRELDVAIRSQERLAAPLEALAAAIRESAAGGPGLVGRIEAAEAALLEWEARLLPESQPGAWMIVSAADPLHPATEWVQTLVEMELEWCQRLHLSAAVVAYESKESEVVRVALEVEGPGAAVLEMEHGLHRLVPSRPPQRRARVDVFARRAGAEAGIVRVMPMRRRKGLFDLELCGHARQSIPARGLELEWLGARHDALRHLVSDLDAAWGAAEPAALDTARVYDGSGARDPRTGAMVPRLKHALRGKLEPLLSAWRARSQVPHPTLG